MKKVTVGVISTGDELVPPEAQPGPGQVRDVNSPMLEAMLSTFGCHVVNYGIVVDDEALLSQKINQAIAECDAVLLSGGSSVGVKDAASLNPQASFCFTALPLSPENQPFWEKPGKSPLWVCPGIRWLPTLSQNFLYSPCWDG